MKTVLSSFLPVALFFALFIGCSDGGGGSVSNGGRDEGDKPINIRACGSVDEILQCAVESLKKEKWDEAVAYYDAAYQEDNTSTKAIIYSVLANLARISTDPKMVSLMKEHFGFTTYPNKLNALLSDSWMKEYRDEYENCYWNYNGSFFDHSCVTEYDVVSLPNIKTPTWVMGSGSIYNKALLSGNVLSVDNFAISLIANVIDKNSNGFNTLLDDVIDGVFGPSYNLALERLKKLENRREDRIKLDPYFIDELDLEDIFDEHDQVGWAEVNAILSATLLVKASLEWVQSYDLNTDLNWLRYAWKDDNDDIRNNFINNASASKLPFKNNFLKIRSGKMEKAKADYIKAIQGFQSSYKSIESSAHYPSKVTDALRTINEGFGRLITAINDGGKFYIPEDPTKGTWPTSKRSDVEATINLGKFFTEGYFSLQNIFETTSDGNPVFYLTYGHGEYYCEYERYEYEDGDYYEYPVWCGYAPEPDPVRLSKINAASLISEGGRLALALKKAPFSALIDEQVDDEVEFLSTGLNGKDAKAVFDKYYP
ncbi:MAG: hypothetical protein LBC64_09670 [Fibromonadaceae bacterium]|jgi:hypothetical protein|nr:hypothetical protein [Fibromonadaceae bacterium]